MSRFYVGFTDNDSVTAWVRDTALLQSLIFRNIYVLWCYNMYIHYTVYKLLFTIYMIKDSIVYFFYIFLPNNGQYETSNPEPQHQLNKFIKLLSTRVCVLYSYSTRVDSKHTCWIPLCPTCCGFRWTANARTNGSARHVLCHAALQKPAVKTIDLYYPAIKVIPYFLHCFSLSRYWSIVSVGV